jgi:hypothetical protein
MSLSAYNNSPAAKASIVAGVAALRQQGLIVQGDITKGGASWAVNSQSYDPPATALLLGVPVEMVTLLDAIFDALAPAAAVVWPEAFLMSIAPGADLTSAWLSFASSTLAAELPARDNTGLVALITAPKNAVRKFLGSAARALVDAGQAADGSAFYSRAGVRAQNLLAAVVPLPVGTGTVSL